MRKRCFVVMPFEPAFNDIFQVIGEAAEACGLECKRGDHRLEAGPIVEQIVDDIRRADLVVADLTNKNPNVFYEIGIAHQLKNPRQVVLITQRESDVPFDLQAHRYVKYEHHEQGRVALRDRLAQVLTQAMVEDDRPAFESISGKENRTQRIVADLKAILERDRDGSEIPTLQIRIVAGLSSLAISDRELAVASASDATYYDLLVRERNALREILARGARLKAVLHPPERYQQHFEWRRLDLRFQRLIGLLEGQSDSADEAGRELDLQMIAQCEFVLTDVHHLANTLLLGDKIAFEGIRRGIGRGFAMTHRISVPADVENSIQEFERLFAVGQAELQQAHNNSATGILTKLKEIYARYADSCPR